MRSNSQPLNFSTTQRLNCFEARSDFQPEMAECPALQLSVILCVTSSLLPSAQLLTMAAVYARRIDKRPEDPADPLFILREAPLGGEEAYRCCDSRKHL